MKRSAHSVNLVSGADVVCSELCLPRRGGGPFLFYSVQGCRDLSSHTAGGCGDVKSLNQPTQQLVSSPHPGDPRSHL